MLESHTGDFYDLQRTTFHRVVTLTLIVAWVYLWINDLFLNALPRTSIGYCLAISLVCAASYAIQKRRPRAAPHLLVIGLWVCLIWWAQYSGAPLALYLLSTLGPIASVLTTQRSAFALTFASSLVIVMSPIPAGPEPLIVLWIVFLTGTVVLANVYWTLENTQNYQDYFRQQMYDAREQRAELVKTSKALRAAQDNLAHTNRQLRQAYRAAEEARRLKAQFAANVSHEFRTPINLIVGFSEMIVTTPQAYGVPLPYVYRADVHAIYRNAKHLQGLINDVLDVSQIEAGQMLIVREEVDFRALLTETAALARDLVESRGLGFQVALPDHLPTLPVDRLRIRQIILNLLSNAARFTDSGTVKLWADLEGADLCIGVSDTGIGIPSGEMGRIFDEFYQSESALSRRKGGSGLGLTLSKRFAEMHGGILRVESAGIPGQGSTFRLLLPLSASGGSKSIGLGLATPEPVRETREFLVLDDDAAVTQMFERYAGKHHAIGVSNAEEAARLAGTISPAAIIVDKQRAAVLEDAIFSASPVPVITCQMPSGRRAMQQRGVTDYLVKPVSADALLNALSELAGQIKTVLIVDDDPDLVRMFGRMLQAEPHSYQVWKAFNGREGLAMMRQQPPDAVILDLLMPDMDGMTVIEQMKADPLLAQVPIVLASARGAVDAILPTTGGELVVRKPSGFQPIELVQCVEALVSAFTPASGPMLAENLPVWGASAYNR
jgi:signal transduction histidine kinase/DNA-binding response OmpR family regulator